MNEKDKEIGKFKLLSVVGFLFISIIGTLLHFTYEWSGKSLIVATFSAVNESVWEHLKIAIMPTFLWTILELIILKYRPNNLWCSSIAKILTIMISIIVLFYLSIGILGSHNMLVSIAIFYLSILFGQIVGLVVLYRDKINVNIEELAKYLVIFLFLLFVLFTFLPPKIPLFKDDVTQTYGVFKFEY